MNVEALVLIQDDREAQKLCVTWPQVGPQHATALEMIREHADDPQVGQALLEDARQHWSEISGVDITDVERLEPILFANGILGPAGVLADEVRAFIRQRIAAQIGGQQRARQRGGN